jgi:putative DNA methylase
MEKWRRELAHQKPQDPDREFRKRIETYLDKGCGCAYLKDVRIADMVQNALLHFDGDRYRLTAWVIMPNHIHLLLTPFSHQSLSRIMQSIKSYTAQEANKLLNRAGHFWMQDYFDRFIRDELHYERVIAYIENNPVKAGLCLSPSDWPWSSAKLRSQRS